jgi:hypothetical protein
MVAVRDDAPVLAEKLQLMVPELVPVAPNVIVSQLPPDVTEVVQDMVPAPVFETLNVVVPAFLATSRLTGDTDRTGCVGVAVGACVTVTSLGLPAAPVAVTRMVAVRTEMPVLAEKLQLMVPELVPLAPDVMESQVPPDITAAVQGIVPPPVFETLKIVAPDAAITFWFEGVTAREVVPSPAYQTS